MVSSYSVTGGGGGGGEWSQELEYIYNLGACKRGVQKCCNADWRAVSEALVCTVCPLD